MQANAGALSPSQSAGLTAARYLRGRTWARCRSWRLIACSILAWAAAQAACLFIPRGTSTTFQDEHLYSSDVNRFSMRVWTQKSIGRACRFTNYQGFGPIHVADENTLPVYGTRTTAAPSRWADRVLDPGTKTVLVLEEGFGVPFICVKYVVRDPMHRTAISPPMPYLASENVVFGNVKSKSPRTVRGVLAQLSDKHAAALGIKYIPGSIIYTAAALNFVTVYLAIIAACFLSDAAFLLLRRAREQCVVCAYPKVPRDAECCPECGAAYLRSRQRPP